MKALSLFGIVGICLMTAVPALAGGGDVVVLINETDADQTSTDTAEFIELYDGGIGDTDLTGLVVVLFNGSDDEMYTISSSSQAPFDLDGLSTDANGYFVIGGRDVPGIDARDAAGTGIKVQRDNGDDANSWLQQGADAVALYLGDAADFPNDTPVTTTNLLDAIVYDTSDGDDAGLLVLLNDGQPQVNEDGGVGSTIDSNQRCPNGSGGARNTDTYAQATPTAGQDNNCVFGACCDDSTGDCTPDVTEASCDAVGNRYGGDGSDCDTINPPCLGPPTGACCDDSTGDCTNEVTEDDCEGADNRYGGDGSDCDTINPPCLGPPTGACCSAGFCGDDVTEDGCETEGGTYQGDDSQCPQDCGPESTVIINEIRIDQPGSDKDEYFELAGDSGESLDGLTYIVIGDSSSGPSQPAGRSGSIEAVISLAGLTIPADGFFLAVEKTNWSGDLAPIETADLAAQGTPLNFENGDNVSHLLVAGFTGAFGDLLDTDRDGFLDITPWAAVVDGISLIEKPNGEGHTPPGGNFDEWDYGFGGGIGPDGNFVPGQVYRCYPSGDWTIGGFDEETGQDTAGTINVACAMTLIIKQGACPAPVNPHSNGVISMVLVGLPGLDINNDVVLDSLELRRCDGEGDPATPLANHTHVADLNHPFDGEVGCGECSCNDDQSSDGISDLVLKFRTDTTLEDLGITASDGVVGVELTGSFANGLAFVARDCMVVVPPSSGQSNATMQSNVLDTFIEVAPLDLNVDSDGFADFSRSYVSSTTVTVTAPTTSQGRRFLRWSVDNILQPVGIRTLEVTVGENTTLKALYQRPTRMTPDRPTEGSGDME